MLGGCCQVNWLRVELDSNAVILPPVTLTGTPPQEPLGSTAALISKQGQVPKVPKSNVAIYYKNILQILQQHNTQCLPTSTMGVRSTQVARAVRGEAIPAALLAFVVLATTGKDRGRRVLRVDRLPGCSPVAIQRGSNRERCSTGRGMAMARWAHFVVHGTVAACDQAQRLRARLGGVRQQVLPDNHNGMRGKQRILSAAASSF